MKALKKCPHAVEDSLLKKLIRKSYELGVALKDYSSLGASLAAQWIRLHTPSAGGPDLIPGQGTRSHRHAATKSSHATAKTWCNQINK